MRRSRLAWQYMARGLPVPDGVECIFPLPPQAMRGQELRTDYISILSQAQRMDEINGIQKLVQMALSVAPSKPDVLDKISFDEAIDIIGDRLSVPAQVIVSTQVAEKFRQARAQQAAKDKQLQQQQQTAQVGAQALKNLGSAPLGAGNALEHLMGVQPQGNA
jgi:uncharacterized protein with von Willebrand factor type A (vWA) domain